MQVALRVVDRLHLEANVEAARELIREHAAKTKRKLFNNAIKRRKDHVRRLMRGLKP